MHRCRDAQQADLILDGHAWQLTTLREAATTYRKLCAYKGAQWPDFAATMERLFAEAPEAEQAWFHQQQVDWNRTTIAPDNLATLETIVQAQRTATSETPACALDTMVQIQTEAASADPAQCTSFWAHVEARLSALALDPATRQAIEDRLAQEVPHPSKAGLRLQLEVLSQTSLVPMAPPADASVGTRPALSPGRLPGGLYVRWKRRPLRRSADTALRAMLVRSVWHQGTARQQVVGYLASIRARYCTAPAHRAWFWERVDARLDTLGLDGPTRQTVEARLAQVVPRPTVEEMQAVAAQRIAMAQWAAARFPGASSSCPHDEQMFVTGARGGRNGL